MAWFTPAELRLRMGDRAFVECTDDDRDGRADTEVLAAITAEAESFVQGYVAEVGATFGVTTPNARLKQLSIVVAMQIAYERRPEFSVDGKTPVQRSFENAQRELESISKGLIRIGPTMADSPTPSPSVGSSSVSAGSPSLVSYDTDDSLCGCD